MNRDFRQNRRRLVLFEEKEEEEESYFFEGGERFDSSEFKGGSRKLVGR